MVFPTRKARFLTFLSTFNEPRAPPQAAAGRRPEASRLIRKNLNTIIPLDNCVIPTLEDG